MKLLRDVVKRNRDGAESWASRRARYYRTCIECGWHSLLTLFEDEVRHAPDCSLYNPENEVEEYG